MQSSTGSRARVVSVALALAASFACATATEPLDVSSAQTAAQVITVLVNDPEIGARPIDVQVTRGVVRLSGRVRSQEELQRAIELARSVPGVIRVDAAVRIGADPLPDEELPRMDRRQRAAVDPAVEFAELRESRDRLALGASLGASLPTDAAFESGRSLGPLMRFGSGPGLRATVGFDWFRATLVSASPSSPASQLRVRPLMVGLAYTLVAGPVSVAPSLVGGYALNSVNVPDTGAAGRLAVDVGNSLAWRPAVSVWIDTGARTAVNVSVGRMMTRLNATFVEDGLIDRRVLDGNSTMVSVGLAYKLF
jgi:hyperosmotically inducible periplasmic protein